MPVITINGPIGCGSVTVGQLVAEKLGIDFVDRLVLTDASKLARVPVWALIEKEQRRLRFRDHLGDLIQGMLERSTISSDNCAGGPYLPWPPVPYGYLGREPTSNSTKVRDNDFIDVTTSVVKDLYRKGTVIIVGRGVNVILGGNPGVLHVGLLAPSEVRAETLTRRDHLERREAAAYVEELELARVKYFRKFFGVHPNEPGLYHAILNKGKLQPESAAEIIAPAVEDAISVPEIYSEVSR